MSQAGTKTVRKIQRCVRGGCVRGGALLLAMLLALSLLAGQVAAQSPVPSSVAVTSSILVRFNSASPSDRTPTTAQQGELRAAGAIGRVAWLGESGLYRVGIPAGDNAVAVAATLEQNQDVHYAEPNQSISLADPEAHYEASSTSGGGSAQTWELDAIEVPKARALGTGQGVVVAVLDTGVSGSHPDLAGHVLTGWNFVQNNADTSDDAGHGTFVAGLIAGVSEADHEGVAPGASILPVKILDGNGVGSTASFVAGINYAVDSGARIINISASGAGDSPALNDALANAEAHGVLVVASAGNDGQEELSYPAAVPTVLAVTATDHQNAPATFSTYGPYVDIAAPGVDIWSSWWSASTGDSHATASGSSASAPLVSGVAAVVAGLRPDATPATIREIITESAVDVGTPGLDAQTGFGMVDAYTAALMASPPSGVAADGQIVSVQAEDGAHMRFTGTGFSPSEPLTLWSTSASGAIVVHRSARSDQSGKVDVDLGPSWRFPEGALTVYAVGKTSGHSLSAGFDMAFQPATGPFKPVAPVPSTSDRTYFAATGHTLSYGFKHFWEANGGLAVFGYPISEEFSEKNPDTGITYTVQYFERNRFEYHPEYAGTSAEVSLGRLGVQAAAQSFPTAIPTTASNVLYFSATQHTLSGSFRSYWESHGGLAIFGYPTSEPFEQGGVLVQYFERACFELHPNLAQGDQVLLSRLGISLARADGYLQ